MSETKVDCQPWSLRDSLQANSDATGAPLILLRFSEAVESRLPLAAARMFAVDGVFRPGNEEIRGRDNIEAFYTLRLGDPRRSTRHLWSNVEHRLTSNVEAQLNAVLTVYAFEPQVSATHLQLRVGNVQCRCILDSENRWVFSEHLYVRAFSAHLPLNLPTESTGRTLPP